MTIASLLLVGAVALTSENLWAASGRRDSIQRLHMLAGVPHSIMSSTIKASPKNS